MADPNRNSLHSDVHIKGSLNFRGEMFFDGTLEGDVKCQGTFIAGPNAKITGNITGGAIRIEGNVTGNVSATDRCELKPAGRLIGDLVSPRLAIEEGATFVGKSEVNPSAPAKK